MESKWAHEIPGFEECFGYKVYANGEIVSYKGHGGIVTEDPQRKLKGSPTTKGYLRVDIRPKRAIKIHRLVALAFIENVDGKPQVNHIDGNKTNNSKDNLEWVTNAENQKHAYEKGLNVAKKGKDNYQFDKEHKNCKKVVKLSISGEELETFNSIAMAGRSMGKGPSSISKCCSGEIDTAYGFKWKFVN